MLQVQSHYIAQADEDIVEGGGGGGCMCQRHDCNELA